jgi:hypothetical protein
MWMTLKEIIKIASDAYPDGLVELAHQGKEVGDSLATLIANEIEDHFDSGASDKEQLMEAAKRVQIARDELSLVRNALISKAGILKLDDEDAKLCS